MVLALTLSLTPIGPPPNRKFPDCYQARLQALQHDMDNITGPRAEERYRNLEAFRTMAPRSNPYTNASPNANPHFFASRKQSRRNWKGKTGSSSL